jgi:hypothetical protein
MRALRLFSLAGFDCGFVAVDALRDFLSLIRETEENENLYTKNN